MSVEPRTILRGEKNWRLRGLLAAHPDIGGTTAARELGRAWPTKKTEYRNLGIAEEESRTGARRAYNPMSWGQKGEREMSVAKDVMDSDDVRKLEGGKGVNVDKFISRALLKDSVTELDVLYREQLLDTVIRGAEPRQIARNASSVTNVDTTKGDIPRGSQRLYADSVARGAEIETDEENYDTVSWDVDKFGQGFEVTDELIDQGIVDVIERQVEFTGAAVENALNRQWLNNLVDSAGNEFDTTGSGQDVSMVNKAIEQVEVDDFGPVNSMVMHPEFKTALFEDSNLAYANRAGSDEVLRNREFNSLFGTEMFTASDGTYDSTETWGFDADGEIGGVVYNKDFVNLVIYQDLTVKNYEDPIRDLQGGNVRLQCDSLYHQPDAASRVEY